MHFRLTDEIEAMVRAQAEREGRSMNAVINDAVAEYLAYRRHREMVRTEIGCAISEHHSLLNELR